MADTIRDSPLSATLYRMAMQDHTCPYGLKAKQTTPQVYIDNTRIGGYEALRKYLGLTTKSSDETTYQPVIAIFSVTALMALAVTWAMHHQLLVVQTIEWFIAISMCVLGIQKLQDIERFSTMFLNYDLLAQRDPRYGYIYPFVETLAGVLMLAGALIWLAAPAALFVGTIGAISVFKAVYIDKRELKCACVGGSSRVPLGFVSLTENIMMMVMGTWMLYR